MKEVLNSIKVGLLQRIESPLVGSFGVFFVLFNWRGISVFLFSSKPVEERLAYIEQTYSHSCYYLWLPLLFALVLTFAHPLIGYWITKYLMWIEAKKQSLRQTLKNQELAELLLIRTKEAELDKIEDEKERRTLRINAEKTRIEGLGNVLNNAKDSTMMSAALNTLDQISRQPV